MEEETHDEDVDSTVNQILNLLYTAGYVDATNSDTPPSQKIAAGITWCIAALNANTIHDNSTNCIEESLKLLGSPYSLQASHIRDLDIRAIFPVVQWLASQLSSTQERENTVELNHRKMNVSNQLDELRERINKEGVDFEVQKFISLMATLKDLERKENHFMLNRDSKHSELQAEISELERKIANDSDSNSLIDDLHHSIGESLEKVDLMKKQLAAKLRDVVAIRRKIDDLPCQSEIIQYERRLSELYAQIQGKHRQTRKYYSTYNALLEIKELMLKETSLLNSIISQFQEAFSTTDGRIKLVHSMEGIVRGSQQKLEKVQLGLQLEERHLNDLKDKYAAAIGKQNRCYSLMKVFQEKCAKNDRFRGQISK